MYAALLQDQSRDGFSRNFGVDAKVSREFGKLEGGFAHFDRHSDTHQ